MKFAKTECKKELSAATYMCTMHGKNMTHNTENCYTLKNQKATAQFKTGKKTFTKKGLKNEINSLCKHTPKDKVLDQYMAVIQKEKARLKKSKKAEAAEVPTEDSDSDTNISMNLI